MAEVAQISDFKKYNISIKLNIMYVSITEYPNLLFFYKCQRLFTINLTRVLQTIAN